jgi:hypothetical protein
MSILKYLLSVDASTGEAVKLELLGEAGDLSEVDLSQLGTHSPPSRCPERCRQYICGPRPCEVAAGRTAVHYHSASAATDTGASATDTGASATDTRASATRNRLAEENLRLFQSGAWRSGRVERGKKPPVPKTLQDTLKAPDKTHRSDSGG